VFMMRGDSHYEKGNMYLKEKKYAEALSEYQKVEASDKEFRMAQSKVNYINGLNSFNSNMYPAALMFLGKVAQDDEYYQASQLMIQKITETTETNNLRSQIDSLKVNRKDTIIVKQEVTTNPGTGNVKQNEAVTATELNKRFFVKLDKSINSFESQYQAAVTAQVTSKKDYLSKMEAVRRDLVNSVNESTEKDAELTQLKSDINTWIDKRIAFINKLIAENSVSETNTSRSLREEGDKLHFRVTSLQKKVRGKY
jgi:tetratricopeptide (TPR) repeat protein